MQINPATCHPLSLLPKNTSKGKLIREDNRWSSTQSSMSVKNEHWKHESVQTAHKHVVSPWGSGILLRVPQTEQQRRAHLHHGTPVLWPWSCLSLASTEASYTTSCYISLQLLLSWRYWKHLATQASSEHRGCLLRVLGDLEMQDSAGLQNKLGTSINQNLQNFHPEF